MKGCVYLVGAGPGDPGLLTLKAMHLIQKADLIVYDYLANPAHLRHASRSCVNICVGRGFRHKKLSQQRINRLIVRSAKQGKTVVRLKGGDPFLFGRGGEEALFLYRHRVPFQVVPGITSAVACATYAGIPLTHRDYSSSVTFLTGHKAEDDNLDSIRWENIVSLGGTLVIYMGFYNLKKITERLVAHGMPSKTRVAMVEWGTLGKQRSCRGTLTTVASEAAKKKLKAPCIIIIGEVIALKDRLNWFENLPLFGKKIAVTRTLDPSAALRERLEGLGAEVLEFPTIEIKPPSSFAKLDRAIRKIGNYDWIIFSSVPGVRSFFERLAQLGLDARALAKCRVAAVGPMTSQESQKAGVVPDLVPDRFETKAIANHFKKKFKTLRGKKFLLVRGELAPEGFEKELKKLMGTVDRVDAYRTLLPKSVPASIKNFILKERVDAVTFTSASTVAHFVKIIGLKAARALSGRAAFASIGPVTSNAMKKYGLRRGCQASVYTLEGLIEILCKSLNTRQKK